MALTKVPQSQLADSSVGTTQLADGALSADTAGRAKMSDSFVTTSKLSDSALSADTPGRAKMADNFLSADAAGRAKMADSFVTQTKVATGVSGTGPAFSVYLTANQSVSSGVTTKVAMNAEEFDTAGAFDPTTNFRFQPAIAGYYMVTAHIGASASTAGTILVPYLYKNGSVYKQGHSYIPPSGSSSMQGSITALVYLNGSTDYVELWANNTGSGTNTFTGGASTTWMQGAMVRAA